MSATVEANTSPSWPKRRHEEDANPPKDAKRARYYYRLESESSRCSEEDTESVCSLQDKETDIVQDSSDTEAADSDGGPRADEYEVEFEYEVASLSEEDEDRRDMFETSNSSGTEEANMMLVAAAAAICDSSLEAWITDVEDSDNSSTGDASLGRKVFPTCAQCNSANDHPLYRYCDKCFQDRKRFFPPRPRRNKKSKRKTQKQEKSAPPVKLDALRNCLSGLSQDSGIGSSQELASLELDQIVVPEHLTPGTSSVSESLETDIKGSQSSVNYESDATVNLSQKSTDIEAKSRKRSRSESSQSESENEPKIKKSKTETEDLCMFCNDAPKDSIFLHTKIAHRCCCYRCAKKTLSTIKRCPICNRSVNKVVRIYTS